MSFEQALDINLAAAVGDDDALVLELRGAFLDSARRHADAMAKAGSDAEWRDAALRLKGLAASFGASDLMTHAARAAEGARTPELLGGVQRGLAILAL